MLEEKTKENDQLNVRSRSETNEGFLDIKPVSTKDKKKAIRYLSASRSQLEMRKKTLFSLLAVRLREQSHRRKVINQKFGTDVYAYLKQSVE